MAVSKILLTCACGKEYKQFRTLSKIYQNSGLPNYRPSMVTPFGKYAYFMNSYGEEVRYFPMGGAHNKKIQFCHNCSPTKILRWKELLYYSLTRGYNPPDWLNPDHFMPAIRLRSDGSQCNCNRCSGERP
jgi:hypothetical protein